MTATLLTSTAGDVVRAVAMSIKNDACQSGRGCDLRSILNLWGWIQCGGGAIGVVIPEYVCSGDVALSDKFRVEHEALRADGSVHIGVMIASGGDWYRLPCVQSSPVVLACAAHKVYVDGEWASKPRCRGVPGPFVSSVRALVSVAPRAIAH